jgi:PAS domain S-box-containing protein
VSIFRDITSERRIEEERVSQAAALELQNRELTAQADALARERALFRSLVDTAGISIVGLDMSGVVFEWNRETELLYGVPRAEAIGRSYAEHFVTAKYREQMYQGMAAVQAGRTLRNLVGPVRTPQGERHTVLWNIAPLRTGPDGPVHGMIAAGLDITEREASDERFRILFERSSDAHMLFDDERGVIDCNDATVRLLRYTNKDSILGRHPKDLSPRRQPDGRLSIIVGEQMRRLARLHGYNRFQWAHLRADGSEIPVEVTLTPIRLHGREVTLAVWHDITEQKKVEEALRKAKEAAESANTTKSEFMTRMNHELRTPLTAIIGFSRVLIHGKEGALPEGAQRYVERIRVNGMHLLSLINQILDVAKVEAGRMELELDTVAVDGLVQETLGMLETTAEAKGLVLRSEVPPRVAPIVTDAGKLRQVLINLVGNAVKFTNKGEVCVSVQIDPVTFRPVSVSVRDTGIGIPADRQDKVFDPFEQGDSSTRREFGGTGLGLSIVKTFAELIGARIEIESEVGKGTTFTIRFVPAATRPGGERKLGERKAHSA